MFLSSLLEFLAAVLGKCCLRNCLILSVEHLILRSHETKKLRKGRSRVGNLILFLSDIRGGGGAYDSF